LRLPRRPRTVVRFEDVDRRKDRPRPHRCGAAAQAAGMVEASSHVWIDLISAHRGRCAHSPLLVSSHLPM
jgi:hypothetical protein